MQIAARYARETRPGRGGGWRSRVSSTWQVSALVSQGACEQAVLCARGAADGAPALFRNLVEACDLRSELHRLVRAPLSAAERASLEEYVRERGGVRADPMLRLISMVQPAGAEPYKPPPPRTRSDRETEARRIRMMDADRTDLNHMPAIEVIRRSHRA